MEWTPILEGDLAARASRHVDRLLAGLASPDGPPVDLAILWTYASASLDTASSAEHADAALGRFMRELVANPPEHGALHGGLAGAGWLVAHVADGADALLATIDAKLVDEGPDEYDLISGTAGVAVYVLERGRVDVLDRLVTRLGAMPRGDCGVAHGTPGAIAVLAKIAARRDVPDATRAHAAALRDDAVAWLLAQRTGDRFPSFAGQPQARDAWCYGDPGVTLALWHSGLPAAELAPLVRAWTERAPERSGVIDAGLCHGAAGLAHIANRMFHASGDTHLRDVARAWFERALAYAPPALPDLVDGRAGVALALLAAISEVEPAWDRLLLMDLSPA